MRWISWGFCSFMAQLWSVTGFAWRNEGEIKEREQHTDV